MGGCRCSYKNCKNTTKTTENVHFFHYPVKHKERCKIWIENADKPQFCDLEEDQLRNKVICEIHFENKWFPNTQKKRLLQGAIPTLDPECTEITPSQELPIFLPSQIHDIQVLPANADGTIFVLDTDNMFTKSQKVESYLYKNGVIVPAKENKSKLLTTTLNSTVLDMYSTRYDSSFNLPTNCEQEDEQMQEIQPVEYKVTVKKELHEYTEVEKNKSNLQRIEQAVKCAQEPREQERVYAISNSNSSHKKTLTRTNPKSIIEKSVSRNCLRKIKQHSRDIATIKRMLKQKSLSESKPDINTMLNSMKEQLPPTFFTILNLNLDNKCTLTDDDIEFFTTVHKTSPEVYQLLINKYKWNLPSVNIVETSME